ncbi:unnamed protein product [Ixodes persulcatus]
MRSTDSSATALSWSILRFSLSPYAADAMRANRTNQRALKVQVTGPFLFMIRQR